MSAVNRVSLSFGDSPEEEFAVSVLRTKGRRKALYVARCIAAYEKRNNAAVAKSLTPENIRLLRELFEQIARKTEAQSEPAGEAGSSQEQNKIHSNNTVATDTAVREATQSPVVTEDANNNGAIIDVMDEDLAAALLLFDF